LAFVSFTVGVLAKTRARPVSKSVLKATIEGLQHRCAETASEMQCPCHQRNARVIVDGENLYQMEIEVICCCDRFANRVRDALLEPLE